MSYFNPLKRLTLAATVAIALAPAAALGRIPHLGTRGRALDGRQGQDSRPGAVAA